MLPTIEADREWPTAWSWQRLTEQAYVETSLCSKQISEDLHDPGLHLEPIRTVLCDLQRNQTCTINVKLYEAIISILISC